MLTDSNATVLRTIRVDGHRYVSLAPSSYVTRVGAELT